MSTRGIVHPVVLSWSDSSHRSRPTGIATDHEGSHSQHSVNVVECSNCVANYYITEGFKCSTLWSYCRSLTDNRWWHEYFLLLNPDDYLCSSPEIFGIQPQQNQSFTHKQRTFKIATAGRRHKLVLILCGLHCLWWNQSLAPKPRTSKIATARRRRYLLLISVDYKFAAKPISLSPALRTFKSATLGMSSVREHSCTRESLSPTEVIRSLLSRALPRRAHLTDGEAGAERSTAYMDRLLSNVDKLVYQDPFRVIQTHTYYEFNNSVCIK